MELGSLQPLVSALVNDLAQKANGIKLFAWFSNVDLLGDAQRVFKLDAKIPHRAVYLGVSEQKLDCTKIAGFMVNERGLCAPHRMGAVSVRIETNRRHPIPNQTPIPQVLQRHDRAIGIFHPALQTCALRGL